VSGNGSKRLLVVEDDRDIRESLQDLLEVEGYAVFTAENGKDALDRLHGMDAPDLILLDLMMPVMSGDEFLRQLRKDDSLRSIPVLVVSAWTDEANKVLDLAQGYVTKPIAVPELLSEIGRFA
jgi:CheY-like chemotaxis protein